jgi:hypothetical protein
MTDIDCESIRVAAMALADGEESPLLREEIELHLSNCDQCRAEIESLHSVNELLSLQKRLRSNVDIWPLVNERLETTTVSAPRFNWQLSLLFGMPLLGYQILLLSLPATPSLWSKLVPVVLAIAVFGYLRTNPFKINSELTLRGELSS